VFSLPVHPRTPSAHILIPLPYVAHSLHPLALPTQLNHFYHLRVLPVWFISLLTLRVFPPCFPSVHVFPICFPSVFPLYFPSVSTRALPAPMATTHSHRSLTPSTCSAHTPKPLLSPRCSPSVFRLLVFPPSMFQPPCDRRCHTKSCMYGSELPYTPAATPPSSFCTASISAALQLPHSSYWLLGLGLDFTGRIQIPPYTLCAAKTATTWFSIRFTDFERQEFQ
jgi:hypothetical protein